MPDENSLAFFRFPDKKVELCIKADGILTVVELRRGQFWNLMSDGMRHLADNHIVKGGA